MSRRFTHADRLIHRDAIDRQEFLDTRRENGGSELLIEDAMLSADFVQSVFVDLYIKILIVI